MISPRRRSGIACLLLLVYLPACTSWQVGTSTPAQFVQTEQPDRVRVTRADGTKMELRSPVVQGDSLVGTAGEDTTSHVSLLLSDVQSVAVQKVSAGKTTLAVAGGLVVVLVIAYLIDCGGKTGWDALYCP